MATAELPVTDHLPLATVRRRSLWRDASRRFFRNRLSIIGLILVAILLIAAIFADDALLAPFVGREAQPLVAHYRFDEATLE